jgi:fructokinase
LSESPRRAAIVFGEVVVDVYPDEEVPAGAALHVAAHLAASGWSAHIVTRTGTDRAGEDMDRLLRRHGVATDLVERDLELPTGRSTIHTSGNENTFTVHGPAAWDAIEGPAELPPHNAVSFGTLAARDARSRAAMTRILGASNAEWKVLDVNLRPPDVDRDVLLATLGAATAVKLSEQELADVADLVGIDADEEALFEVAPHARRLCVTRGDRGASLLDRSGGRWTQEAPEIEVVNTVGAGDAFTAGMIEGLVEALPPDEVLNLAQARAASILARRGGLPRAGVASGASGKEDGDDGGRDRRWSTGDWDAAG